jgi:hypothetical protein
VRTQLSAGYGPPEAYKPRYEVMKRVELVKTALAKDEAVDKSKEGNLDESRTILEGRLEALKSLRCDEHGTDDVEVKEEIENLKSLIQRLNVPYSLSEAEFFKELRSQSYETRRDKQRRSTSEK